MTRYALVEYPPPVLEGQPACTSCAGHGITGQRFTMPVGEQLLLVDEFCPACGGCGRADHARCTFFSPCYETLDREDERGDEEPDDDELEDLCPSCHGRTWWAAQGFQGEGEDTVMHHLRVPCGCTEDRVQYVER